MRRSVRMLGDVWSLAKPYFASSDACFAWAMVSLLLVLSLATVGLGVVISYAQAIFFTALQRKDPDGFLRGLFWFTPRTGGMPMPPFVALAALNIGLNALSLYLQGWLQIRWQKWLTGQFLRDWLSDGTAYMLRLTQGATSRGADNPDQRIQEDIEDFTRNSITFTFGLLTSASTVVSYSALLWSLSGAIRIAGFEIPGYLLWAALFYAVVATWITHRAGFRLAELNFVQQRLRGDFRRGLHIVRDQVEEISLLGGQAAERHRLNARFQAYATNAMRIIGRSATVTFLSLGFDQAAIVFPTAIAAPAFFSGAITFGTLNQIRLGFLQMAEAMLWVVSTYTELAAYVAQTERLRTFSAALAEARRVQGGIRIVSAGEGEPLTATVQTATPGGRMLLGLDCFALAPGETAAIMAPSGNGKSTLLRAIAGLWPFGEGEIRRPAGECAFLPQLPYIPDGTLRAALLYPDIAASGDDASIHKALDGAGLMQLGGMLDVSAPWSQVLSLGEQQRLSIARVLLRRPAWIFMDEPTASLEDAAQAELFAAIRFALPDAAVFSASHRALFANLHQTVIAQREAAGVQPPLSPRVASAEA